MNRTPNTARIFNAARSISAMALLAAGTAQAQQWPVKPVRVVIHQPAGGPTDLVPRAMFNQMGPKLGQPFVVEKIGRAHV